VCQLYEGVSRWAILLTVTVLDGTEDAIEGLEDFAGKQVVMQREGWQRLQLPVLFMKLIRQGK
jgi:hypothetical protein